MDGTYIVSRCETCSRILVYSGVLEFEDSWETKYGDLVYPQPSSFSDSVPKRIRSVYQEALRVKNHSPLAFVILARRILEEICSDKGVYKGNLADSLDQLAAQDIIPKTLAEASSLIRLVGNVGAHRSDTRINALHVFPIDDFLKAIVEYVYVAPAKIAEFKRRFKDFDGSVAAG